jgi:mannose-6-phosphate isomerase-like protein (cupin superfamily)
MKNLAIKNPSRRNFLCTAPVAAAAGLALADAAFASTAAAESAAPAAQAAYRLFTARALQDDSNALQAAPGNNNLVTSKDFVVVLTTETAKSAKEFEWHEYRDHIFQIHEGSTVYELGGSPKNGRNTKPGEWLAPAAEGTTTVTLNKGDMLVIPRGMPHKRSTAGSVTFMLISTIGNPKP